MNPLEYAKAWENWSVISQLNPGVRTGRLSAFFGHEFLIFELSGGTIAELIVSDRQLRIERVMLRMGLLTVEEMQQAFHQPEMSDRSIPLARILLRSGAITHGSLAAAREHQMKEVLRVVITRADSIIFVPGPSKIQRIETMIPFDDVLASAFAEFPTMFDRVESAPVLPIKRELTARLPRAMKSAMTLKERRVAAAV